MNGDTICAVATPPGQGGIAIVRASGPKAGMLLNSAFCPARPGPLVPRRLTYGRAVDGRGETIDEVMAVLMPGPASYTREDVAEIHCHGGDLPARRVMERLLALGARTAEPGEFTRRAFLNGRIDLTRAEAVMEVIGARSEAAARASLRQLQGGVSTFVADVQRRLVSLLALIDAGLDWPDEMEEEATAPHLIHEIREVIALIRKKCDPDSLRLMRRGAHIVLAGRPNVGKSSLLNALLEQDRAIVTEQPGTTRDVLTEQISIGGVLAHISDTAGRREARDEAERIGVLRAKDALQDADVPIVVLDATAPVSDEDRQILAEAGKRAIVVLNKWDLFEGIGEDREAGFPDSALPVSAKTGWGLEALRDRLVRAVSGRIDEDVLTIDRHMELAEASARHLEQAIDALEAGLSIDAAAMDLKAALERIGKITSADVEEAVLDDIFSRFCVGK